MALGILTFFFSFQSRPFIYPRGPKKNGSGPLAILLGGILHFLDPVGRRALGGKQGKGEHGRRPEMRQFLGAFDTMARDGRSRRGVYCFCLVWVLLFLVPVTHGLGSDDGLRQDGEVGVGKAHGGMGGEMNQMDGAE